MFAAVEKAVAWSATWKASAVLLHSSDTYGIRGALQTNTGLRLAGLSAPGQDVLMFNALSRFTTCKPKLQVLLVAFHCLLTLHFECTGLALQPEDTPEWYLAETQAPQPLLGAERGGSDLCSSGENI